MYAEFICKYFDVVRALFNEWTSINDNVLIKTNEPVPTTDVVMGVAVKIMNAESKCINPGMSIPSFVHMKAKINGGYKNDYHWPNKLGFYWQSPKHIKINSVRQHLPIHYHDKSVATDELISKYGYHIKKLKKSQGRILIRLVDRETNRTSFALIKDFRNIFSAGFWQLTARVFGHTLLSEYDPNDGEDRIIEYIINKIENEKRKT